MNVTNHQRRNECSKQRSHQHVAPMMFVVADTRQSNEDGSVDGNRLQQMLEKFAAFPRQTRLEVKLYDDNNKSHNNWQGFAAAVHVN